MGRNYFSFLQRSTKRQADSTMESEIIFYISKTSSERIQMVITDKESGSSSGRRAIEMAQRIRRDMLRGNKLSRLFTVGFIVQ